MNAKMKKSLAVLSLSSMMITGVSYASAPVTAIPVSAPLVDAVPISAPINTIQAVAQPVSILINGEAIAEAGFTPTTGSEPMLPLRAVSERLGFALTWYPETMSVDLAKGSILTTVKTGQDQYLANQTYISLGAAATLVDNKLYVPVSFVNRVLQGSATTQGATVSISPSEQQKKVVATGVITGISGNDKYQSIHIQGYGMSGLVLNAGPDTGYQLLDGTKLNFSDLHVGLTVVAEHSIVSTMSLPPQTPAYNLTVLDSKIEKEMLGTAGQLEDVRTDASGNLSVLIKGDKITDISQDEVVLGITDATLLVDPNGDTVEKSAIVKGAKVIGYYNGKLTKSLPPIGTAWKLVIAKE